jgi:hypothetical protein
MSTYHPPHIEPSHKGLLHEQMGIPQGTKISMGALMREKAKAKKSGNTTEEKRAVFAINFRH